MRNSKASKTLQVLPTIDEKCSLEESLDVTGMAPLAMIPEVSSTADRITVLVLDSAVSILFFLIYLAMQQARETLVESFCAHLDDQVALVDMACNTTDHYTSNGLFATIAIICKAIFVHVLMQVMPGLSPFSVLVASVSLHIILADLFIILAVQSAGDMVAGATLTGAVIYVSAMPIVACSCGIAIVVYLARRQSSRSYQIQLV